MMMETMRKEVEEEEEEDETPEEEMMMMRNDRIHDAEDLGSAFDYASLETDIEAQRMVALEVLHYLLRNNFQSVLFLRLCCCRCCWCCCSQVPLIVSKEEEEEA
jgi:hypothetical protein